MRIKLILALIILSMLCISALCQGQTRDVDSLIKDLKNENSTIRADAASALGDLKDSRGIEPLIEALRDESPEVRIAAEGSLGMSGDPRALIPLIQMLSDENGNVRVDATSILGSYNDTRAVDPLIDALEYDEDYGVRAMAAVSLGVIRDPRAVEPLIQSLDDVSPTVRCNAAVSLGQFLKDPRALNPLIQALDDENGDVRWRAAFALGELKDPRAIDPLKHALQDEDATVRDEAETALKKLEGQQTAPQPQTKVEAPSPTTHPNVVEWPISAGGNGHYYEAVLVQGGITWDDANATAKAENGHLASITSEAENEFVYNLVAGDDRYWLLDANDRRSGHGPYLGGYQPEGSPEPAGGWTWVTGEPFSYANWAAGQPDNWQGKENTVEFFGPGTLKSPVWNDVQHDWSGQKGYIIEWEGSYNQ